MGRIGIVETCTKAHNDRKGLPVTILKRFSGITALLACSAPLGICDVVTTIFSRPLPIANVNNENGPRSNYAFTETGGTDPLQQTAIDGDSFCLGCTNLSSKNYNSYVITSLSTYSVASTLGQPLGDEFQNVMLAVREVYMDPVTGLSYGNWDILDQGTPNTSFNTNSNVVGNSNPNITDTNVTYANGQNYEGDGTPGTYYPLWETTFSNLNFTAQAGVQYQFVVWGFGWNTMCTTIDFQCMDPTSLYGYWFNEYSSPLLSGRFEQGATGSYLSFVNFENTQICPTVSACDGLSPQPLQPQNAAGNTVAVDENVIIDGYGVNLVSTPEPGTGALAGLGLVLFACFSRKLKR
jgi:PEP-CTERM motif